MLIVGILTYILHSHTSFAFSPPSLEARAILLPSSRTENDPSICADQRSVWNIVWSCVITIFACSWVSVHPNISARGESKFMRAMRRLELMFWAIIAPELIIYWAMRQWFGARSLAQLHRDSGWTKTHGYFLQMGGFILQHEDGKEEILTEDRLSRLLEERQVKLPLVPEEELLDKSKADALSKTAVIGQTTWFVTQCIARKTQRLAITELELITIAFAILNGFMYYVWWNKPMDVQVPIFIQKRATAPVVVGNNELGSNEGSTRTSLSEHIGPSWRGATSDTIPYFYLPITGSLTPEPSCMLKRIFERIWEVINPQVSLLYVLWIAFLPIFVLAVVVRRIAEMTIQSNDLNVDNKLLRVPTFYSLRTSGTTENKVISAAFSLAVLFGAIHCIGWFFIFQSHVEGLLWKVSSMVITTIPLAILVVTVVYVVLGCTYPLLAEVAHGDWGVGGLLGLIVLLPLYIAARFILLTLALMDLRNISPEAAAVVVWSNFIPHV